MNIILLISTILIFGLAGGLVNAIKAEKPKGDYWKSIIKGIAAAFLVPVFLEIIKSELGRTLSLELYDYLVFGGLCLLAAIFSDKFIDSVGEKVIRRAEKAEKIAKESNEKVNTLIEVNSEPDTLHEGVDLRISSFGEFSKQDNKENVSKIIKSLKNSDFKFRTTSGIAGESGMGEETVRKLLEDLKDQDIVIDVKTGKRTYWTIKAGAINYK